MNEHMNESYGTHHFYPFGFFSFVSTHSVPKLVKIQTVLVTEYVGNSRTCSNGNERKPAEAIEGKPFLRRSNRSATRPGAEKTQVQCISGSQGQS